MRRSGAGAADRAAHGGAGHARGVQHAAGERAGRAAAAGPDRRGEQGGDDSDGERDARGGGEFVADLPARAAAAL